MDLSTRMTNWRDFGKSVIAGAIVLLLFVSTAAAADSNLHELFHCDHGSPTHVCLVSLLEHGQGYTPGEIAIIDVPQDVLVISATVNSQTFVSVEATLHRGRGPPIPS